MTLIQNAVILVVEKRISQETISASLVSSVALPPSASLLTEWAVCLGALLSWLL